MDNVKQIKVDMTPTKNKYTRPCIVCKNIQKPLYKFPFDEEYKLKWCEAIKIRRHQLKVNSKICIRHFSNDQLVNIRLKQKVVPCRNLPKDYKPEYEENVEENCELEAKKNAEGTTEKTTFVIYEYC